MLELLKQPWHWSVAGVIIGLFVPLLLILGNKSFGISSSMRHICAAVFPSGISYFKYNWKKESWNLVFVVGVIIGGWIAAHLLTNPEPVKIADSTRAYLESIGIREYGALVPTDLFSWESLFTVRGFIFIVVGGFLVGFGTRYAGGCTSGHSIMGLSNLQLPSLIATICFMVGGFIVTWFVIPYL